LKSLKLKKALFFSFFIPLVLFTGCQTKKINIYERDTLFFSGIISGYAHENRFKAKFKWFIDDDDKIIIISNFGNVLADIQIKENNEVTLRLEGKKYKFSNFALMTKEIIGIEVPYELLITSIFNKKKYYVIKQGDLKIQKKIVENSQNLNVQLFSKNANLKILFVNFYD
jgi:outer membrane biogenesis lipoprotein LolB